MSTCPMCGYCSHCGRSNTPSYTQAPLGPVWTGQISTPNIGGWTITNGFSGLSGGGLSQMKDNTDPDKGLGGDGGTLV